MKRTIFLILALMSLVSASSQALTRYEVKINDFTELKVTDNVNVIYRCMPDSAGYAVFWSNPQMASSIMFSPQSDKLTVQLATPDNIKYTSLPTVTVYSSYLTKVENDGDSTLRVYSPQSGPKFKARLIGNGRLIARGVNGNLVEGSIDTGNGTLVLSGKCSDAKLSCTGSGQLLADDLEADNVKCSLWGTGTIGCNARTQLTLSGAGTGTVYYLGNPEIKKKMALKIKCLPAN